MKPKRHCSTLRLKLTTLVLGALPTVSALAAAAEEQPKWTFNPLAWRADAEGFQAEGLGGFAVRSGVPRCGRVTVEAEVRVERSVGPRWKVAGVVVYDDRQNFWQLALAEAPDDEGARRFVELAQMRGGRWLAQANLHCSRRKTGPAWQPGQTYRLLLSLDAEGIEGRVTDAEGAVLADIRYEFTAEAVTAGRPGLRSEGFEASLRVIRSRGAAPVPDAAAEFPPYRSDNFVPGVRGEATGFFRVEKQVAVHGAARAVFAAPCEGDSPIFAAETVDGWASTPLVPRKLGQSPRERLQKQDGRWWTIDPLGRGYVVLGVDHVSYNGHWSEALNTQPYRDRNDAKYASRDEWAVETAERLRRWGFNSLGAGHGAEMIHRGLAHSQFVGIDGMAWAADDDLNITPHEGRPCSAFPNVFHPNFDDYVRYRVEQTCRPWVGDPWLFGYFLDNELAWWGRGDVDTGLFDATMAKPAGHSAKRALRHFLAERYDSDVARFRAAWGTPIEAFDDLLARSALTGPNAETVLADKRAFLRLIAQRYFGTLAREIRRVDPDHMILGCRFAGGHVSDVVWEAAAEHCDVVSVNYYGNVDLNRRVALDHDHDAGGDPLPVPFEHFHALAGGRPLLLTEWSFIGLDSGLPCTEGAGQRFRTQVERAQAAGIYAETLLRMPWMLGYNYFMWVDEPAEGISRAFPENSNYGLVDVDNHAYPKLTETFTRVHRNAARFRREGIDGLPEPPPLRVPAWQVVADRWLRDHPEEAAAREKLRFTRDGDAYTAASGRLTLRGRVGSPNLADDVLLDGRSLGHLHSLVHHVTEGVDRWARTERLERVEGRVEGSLLVLDTVAICEADSPDSPMRSFSLRKRIVLPVGADWMAVEFVELSNTDRRPLDVRGVFFQPRSALGGSSEADGPANAGGVPRLWTAAPGDAWVDDEADLFWGAVAPRGSGVAIRFWLNPHGGQHPDIRWRRNIALQPGESLEPQKPVYTILTAGRDGSEGWDAANRQWSQRFGE